MASTPVASGDRDYAVLITSGKVSSGVTSGRPARNVEGPPGVPGRPSAQTRHFHVTCVEDLQGYPYRSHRRPGQSPPDGTAPTMGAFLRRRPWSHSYVDSVSTRVQGDTNNSASAICQKVSRRRIVFVCRPELREQFRGHVRHSGLLANETRVTGAASPISTLRRRPRSSPPASMAASWSSSITTRSQRKSVTWSEK